MAGEKNQAECPACDLIGATEEAIEERELYHNFSFVHDVAHEVVEQFPNANQGEQVEMVLPELEASTVYLDWKLFSEDALTDLNTILGPLGVELMLGECDGADSYAVRAVQTCQKCAEEAKEAAWRRAVEFAKGTK